MKKHILGFRELARLAEAKREFDCGHDNTKANTIMQFRGRGLSAGLQPECRRCQIAKTNEATRAARALRDQVDPEWRARRRLARIEYDRERSARRWIITKAHLDIAQEMA